jgi:hypothetical protein
MPVESGENAPEAGMRLRGNVILQYTVATFAIVTAITVGLAVVLTRRIVDYQIRSHVESYQGLSGTHFDPEIVAAFQNREDLLLTISERLAD